MRFKKKSKKYKDENFDKGLRLPLLFKKCLKLKLF